MGLKLGDSITLHDIWCLGMYRRTKGSPEKVPDVGTHQSNNHPRSTKDIKSLLYYLMRGAAVLLISGVLCVAIVWIVTASSWMSQGNLHGTGSFHGEPIANEQDDQPKIGKLVFIEVSIDGVDYGRIDIGLYTYDVPITTENFRALLTGERGGQSIIGTVFHRIITNFVIQGGRIYERGNGIPKEEYDAFTFPDEPRGLELKHSGRYVVQMANRGPDTNNSQFCFMLRESKHLNGKHVVFGRVVKGFEIVDAIEDLAASKDGTPRATVKITAGGEY